MSKSENRSDSQPRCCSCGAENADAFRVGAGSLCDWCADTFVHLRAAGLEPERLSWKLRLAPELLARCGGVEQARLRQIAPLFHVPNELAVVLVGPETHANGAIELMRMFPVMKLHRVFAFGDHIEELLRRLTPFVPDAVAPTTTVAGRQLDPIVVAGWTPDMIARRRFMPLARVEDCLEIAALAGAEIWPPTIEEAMRLFSCKTSRLVVISADEFLHASEAIPWGAPMIFLDRGAVKF